MIEMALKIIEIHIIIRKNLIIIILMEIQNKTPNLNIKILKILILSLIII